MSETLNPLPYVAPEGNGESADPFSMQVDLGLGTYVEYGTGKQHAFESPALLALALQEACYDMYLGADEAGERVDGGTAETYFNEYKQKAAQKMAQKFAAMGPVKTSG